MCSTLGAIFKPIGKALSPGIPKSVKQQNQMALEASQAKIAEAKRKALDEREDQQSGGIRILMAGGGRSGYRA